MARRERVTRVIDGDTFETASRKHPVRLAGVDAPEKGEPGYAQAKRALEQLVAGQTVEVDTQARDAYGRSVARVKAGGRSVNRAMQKHSK
jgi:endonuclease YncB( thermonuclease family)